MAATIESLERLIDSLSPGGQYLTIEQYVRANETKLPDESTAQAIARLYPNTLNEFPPATLKILEERHAESAAIDKRRAEEAEERRRR